ncbi:MAG: radical SAM protein [Clostridiales bacterium]
MEYISTKTIISKYKNDNVWFGNNYNMNIYKGCCHGCIYCDSRSNCYNIHNFDEIKVKKNVLTTIEHEIKSKRKAGVIGTGFMSDPYNPYERVLKLTRGALKIINNNFFGVSIDTKSCLVLRDIDILKKISKHSPVIVKVTITTFDNKICQKIEPNIGNAFERFRIIKKLSDYNIFVGVLLMPVLPFINDTNENIFNIIKFAKKNGASFIYPYFGVTLRNNQKDWFFKKLDKLFPYTKEKYIKQFGNKYICNSPNIERLKNLFFNNCEKYGLLYKMEDIINEYKRNYIPTQISLFD